jgi:hypothetical protein
MKTGMTLMSGTMLIVALAAGAEARGPKAKIDLTPATAGVRGKASVSLTTASDGKFEVKVQKLAGSTTYDLLVGGIKVATLHTSRGGSATVRFASRPRGKALLLGFDPRGEAIEIRDASGNDALAGTMPAVGEDAADVTCCVPDDRGPECEDRTQAECDAEGGTVVAAGSCLPDPCGATNPPPSGATTVCCIPDDSGPECEDRTQAECAAAGGSLVQATSCTPNPCAGTPLPADDDIQCCIPAYYVWDCEDRTVAECQAAGGINKGPGTCTLNPCSDMPPPEPSHGLCCMPNAAGDEIECEDRSPTECSAAGGVSKGNGVCAVDTCADVAPPNPDVMCCLPSGNDLECEDRTAAQCAAAGGVSKGAGVCAVDTCGAPKGPDIACCERHSGEFECRERTEAECAANHGTNVGAAPCGATTCDGL